MNENKVILEINNLKKYFPTNKKDETGKKLVVKANDGVSFKLKAGETLALVGESGCGKSTLGRTILRLYDPTEGTIIFNGVDITQMSQKNLVNFRKEMQIIFQDPYSSLNPRMTVGEIIGEGLLEHKIFKKKDENYHKEIVRVLKVCGLADYHINRYPHQFSGGQRQRIGIARALALNPSFVVCDEAVSALDVSIQSQIINLLMNLQKEFSLSYLFITHDLSVVKHISNRVGIMYLGNLIEIGETEEVYKSPKHPYTKGLLSAIPSTDLSKRDKKRQAAIIGEIPSNINPPSGCKFHTRCPDAVEKCKIDVPELKEITEGYFVACHGI